MRKSCQEFVFPFALLLIFFPCSLFLKICRENKKDIHRLCIAKKNNRPYCCLHPTLKFHLVHFTVGQSYTAIKVLQLSLTCLFLSLKKKVLRNLYFCNYFSRPSPLGHLVQEVAQFPQLLSKMHHRLGDPSTSILLSEFLSDTKETPRVLFGLIEGYLLTTLSWGFMS